MSNHLGFVEFSDCCCCECGAALDEVIEFSHITCAIIEGACCCSIEFFEMEDQLRFVVLSILVSNCGCGVFLDEVAKLTDAAWAIIVRV
jgi:hypothetical protein